MRIFSVSLIPASLSGLVALPAMAADLAVKVEVPTLKVAEYHKPYVAVWVERADNSVAANLAVWYDIKMKNNEGEMAEGHAPVVAAWR